MSSSSEDAIERVLFISPLVHVYMIPPLSSSRGHVAANWTKPPAQEIFADQTQRTSPRLRILERSPLSSSSATGSVASRISVTILLESPSTGELFAAAPYTNPNVVMQAVDSARFFAITVVDSGRKATLGIGFEERSEAFDFGVALQEARKTLQWEGAGAGGKGTPGSSAERQGIAGAAGSSAVKRDWSLKEGETLHVDVPKSAVRRAREAASGGDKDGGGSASDFGSNQGSGFTGLLPPPPSAADIKEERRKSREIIDEAKKKELADLGFDDGEFGEFQ